MDGHKNEVTDVPETRSSENSAEKHKQQKWENVFRLGNKYWVLEPAISQNPSSGRNTFESLVRIYPVCVDVKTREQFTCQVIERKQWGSNLMAVYQKLGQNCDQISKVHEVLAHPVSRFCYVILPANFGAVHNYLRHYKKFKEDFAANSFRQMVQAVKYSHEKGVVLRDMRLNKFFFNDKERTLVSMGILDGAVLLQDMNDDSTNDIFGSLDYISPEKAECLLSDDKSYSYRASDIWALGVMLYTMLMGRYPFIGRNPSQLLEQVKTENPVIPDSVSIHAKFLLRCILHKDHSRRPTCGEILNHIWLRERTQLNAFVGSLSDQDNNRVNSNPSNSVSAATNTAPIRNPTDGINNTQSLQTHAELTLNESTLARRTFAVVPMSEAELFEQALVESRSIGDSLVPS